MRLQPHEPHEVEAPVNSMLDELEVLVRRIIAEGGEAPLRARLDRLVPANRPRAAR